jgi:NAD(P)-dependent dehydrogenase (short-subunit alcohol dehydrogenase family)
MSSLDICVNNAGIAEQSPFVDCRPEDLRRVFEVNVIGAFTVMQEAARLMTRQGSGHVVTVASDASYKGIEQMAAYVASKHALLGLARTLRLELRGTGVRETSIFPGPVRTGLLGSVSLAGGMDPQEFAEVVVEITSAGSSIAVDEVYLQPAIPT